MLDNVVEDMEGFNVDSWRDQAYGEGCSISMPQHLQCPPWVVKADIAPQDGIMYGNCPPGATHVRKRIPTGCITKVMCTRFCDVHLEYDA